MKRLTPWLLLLILLFNSVTFAWAADPFPPKPEGNIYVNDFAEMLSPETEQAILTLGTQLEDKTTAQVVVVTVPNLAEQTVEDYAIGLFRKWGIGQKEKNNGVLLLVSREPRKVRIEVGYGLEGALPDSRVGRILDEEVVPFFRQGDYDNSVYRGYAVIAANVAREYQIQLDEPQNRPVPDVPQEKSEGRKRPVSPWERWLPYILVAMFLLDLIFNRARITRTLWKCCSSLAFSVEGGVEEADWVVAAVVSAAAPQMEVAAVGIGSCLFGTRQNRKFNLSFYPGIYRVMVGA